MDKLKKIEKTAKLREQKVIEEKGKVYEFVKSDNWQIIRKKLIDKIIHFDSISNLLDNECTRQDILGNKKAVKLVFDWLNEIEGDAQEYAVLMTQVTKSKEENIIVNLEEEE